MSSSIDTTDTTARRKDHKGGKIVALLVLGTALLIVGVLVVNNLTDTFNNVENKFDRDVVAVTGVTQGDKLQPVSAKVVASDSSTMIVSDKNVKVEDYVDVWQKLATLAPETATDEERAKVIETFLAGLNYQAPEKGGVIVSIANGNPISPETLGCYLNGYIADKPYLKTNCPSF